MSQTFTVNERNSNSKSLKENLEQATKNINVSLAILGEINADLMRTIRCKTFCLPGTATFNESFVWPTKVKSPAGSIKTQSRRFPLSELFPSDKSHDFLSL
jgi:hypothetical protein